MFHIPAVALVLPKSKNKGLNPSLDLVFMILKCCTIAYIYIFAKGTDVLEENTKSVTR